MQLRRELACSRGAASRCPSSSSSRLAVQRPHVAMSSAAQAATAIATAAAAEAVELLPGLQGLVGKGYKALLLDQFGVLHDGKVPYPGAIDATRRLHEAGLQLYIISNSSRRSSGTLKKLAKMGFSESWFSGAVTSGELTHQCLQSRPDAWWQGLGRRCIHLTWSTRGAISLDGLGLQVVTEPGEADFILAHGTEAVGQPGPSPGSAGEAQSRSLQQLEQLLAACAEEGRRRGKALPMVVANPDLVTVDGAELVVMPGTLAKTYAEQGGEFRLMGKPAPLVYAHCMGALGLQPGEVCAVGDSVEHDVGGAAAAGIDAVFVAGGIHAAEVLKPAAEGAAVDLAAVAGLGAKHGAVPRYAVAGFAW